MSDVHLFPVHHLPARDVDDENYRCQLSCWRSSALDLPEGATHFGYVHSGDATLVHGGDTYTLRTGMYFSCPGACQITGQGNGFVATRYHDLGFFQIGGPVETLGRLRYIDGCSDSLLLSPVMRGDPCLNLLYLPPDTCQTCHTHPSCRLGMIISGSGVCRTPDGDTRLTPGLVFEIAPGAIHSFHTTDSPLRVIAWHPDSDCGPAHQDHPMINRTIIDGVSAARRLQS